jgi:hypothetical protein
MLRVLSSHRPELEALHDAAVDRGLAGRFYTLARFAFVHGYAAIGRKALTEAKRLGLADHPGTLAHRLACRLLGLELKVRLTAKLYEAFSRTPVEKRPYPYNLARSA